MILQCHKVAPTSRALCGRTLSFCAARSTYDHGRGGYRWDVQRRRSQTSSERAHGRHIVRESTTDIRADEGNLLKFPSEIRVFVNFESRQFFRRQQNDIFQLYYHNLLDGPRTLIRMPLRQSSAVAPSSLTREMLGLRISLADRGGMLVHSC
jgi:hypothetical protein